MTPPRDIARFGHSDDETLRYLVSLKLILAADGLHPLEEKALSRGMALMGVPDDIRAAVDRFEVRGAILEDVLPQNATKSRARLLVYDAVRLASADGLYADAEREAVARAAVALGVDLFAVRALEGLVQMERVVEQLRRGLLQPE
jgi:hypothetical protein